MVVALKNDLEHLGSLNIVGVDQSSADLLNGGEESANDLVQWLAIGDLEPIEVRSTESVSRKLRFRSVHLLERRDYGTCKREWSPSRPAIR